MRNLLNVILKYVKFIYSEKATKFCEIFTVNLSYVVPVKFTVEISQNFLAFSEYMNFRPLPCSSACLCAKKAQRLQNIQYTVKRSTAAALKLAAAADDHDVLFATSPGPVLLLLLGRKA